MKKILFIIALLTFFVFQIRSQVTPTTTTSTTTSTTTAPNPSAVISSTSPTTPEQEDFDKKFRFGIRVSPQPCWFKSKNTSSSTDGASMGFGFGLAMEFKLSNIVRFSTGIGGDFEGGRISYRNDPNFKVMAVVNNENGFVETKKGMKGADYYKNGSTLYELKSREFRSTMVTVPLLLKMMTSEYSGFRYFGVFGGEIGFRTGAKVNDIYYSGQKISVASGTTTFTDAVDLNLKGINVGKDASFIPVRVGMNLGLGSEYRVAGRTSLVFSVNYFQSFTNLMRKDSKYLSKDLAYDAGTDTFKFTPLNQNYVMRSIRINVAVMF